MNHQQRAIVRLLDAQKACAQLQEVIGDQSVERYQSSIELQWAIQRGLEIIGESVRQATRLDPSLMTEIPESLDIVGMRNRIAHGYEDLNLQLIWDSVIADVPVLFAAIEHVLKAHPMPNSPDDFDTSDIW